MEEWKDGTECATVSPLEGYELAIPFQSPAALLRAYRGRHPYKLALVDVDHGNALTFKELYCIVNGIAHVLRRRGVGRGERVVLIADDAVEKLVLWLSIWRAGGVVCPLSSDIACPYLSEQLRSLHPKLLIYQIG